MSLPLQTRPQLVVTRGNTAKGSLIVVFVLTADANMGGTPSRYGSPNGYHIFRGVESSATHPPQLRLRLLLMREA